METTQIKRHKPKSSVRDKTDPADKATYAKMAEACVEAVIAQEKYVYFVFPYFVKFESKGLPRSKIVEQTQTTDTHKFNARFLLDWLYENGHSARNAFMVVDAGRSLTQRLGKMEARLKRLDTRWEEEDNDDFTQ
jgi:hypothetical protein